MTKYVFRNKMFHVNMLLSGNLYSDVSIGKFKNKKTSTETRYFVSLSVNIKATIFEC